MQLLIIPVVLVVGGFLLNYTTSRNEREIASDNQRAATLQAYIDSMSELLLEKKLRESGEDDEVRKIARVRTLTVLPRLDGSRKASVLQFLYESGLTEKGKRIVDLSEADLNRANLFFADLSKADLSGTKLIEANLGETDLIETDLSNANLGSASLFQSKVVGAPLYNAWLTQANLDEADLSDANLHKAVVTPEQLDKARSLKGTILPDGTKHA